MAPAAALFAPNLINWIAVEGGWEVKCRDVSNAFLQGKPLPAERKVYVKTPTGCPDCVDNYIRIKLGAEYRKGLMRMTKGGFGLPESPRLWYLSNKETLLGGERHEGTASSCLGSLQLIIMMKLFERWHASMGILAANKFGKSASEVGS